MTEPADQGVEVARITITRVLGLDGTDSTWCEAVDPDGEPLKLVESLGLLRLAEDTVIRQAMGETDEDDDR